MKRLVQTFSVNNFYEIKEQLLAWASGYSSCSFLDNNQYASDFHTHECLVAAGAAATVSAMAGGQALGVLQTFLHKHSGDWLFGHLSYDLKEEIEAGTRQQESFSSFSDIQFFVPEIVVRLQQQVATIESLHELPEAVWENILSANTTASENTQGITLQPLLPRSAYLQTVHTLQQHILRGDCYEINFCLPFIADQVSISPVPVFQSLCRVSPMPFACFYRQQQQYLLCASPERFLQKKGNRIYSQPMKGTAPRHQEANRDEQQMQALQASQKERSENVMVADLVRNDLSKICKEGTVQADTLFGIQTYPQVHQMVSTISGELRDNISFTDILKATFPMGSMTGAPKKRVMELIARYEPIKRGLFSGSVGYISPNGNFDFNVVIRSLLYNAEAQRLQYYAGSAITFYSQPEGEYDEVMLKTKAARSILE